MMDIVEQQGGYLYQHCPDICPYAFLSDVELKLWALRNQDKAAARKAARGA